MKKALWIASFIGIFMAAGMDLQARYRGNDLQRHGRSVVSSSRTRQAPARDRAGSYSRYGNRRNSYSRHNNYPGRNSRGGISFGLSVYAPLLDRYGGYYRYYYRPGRSIAAEIRRNEERIWILEERMGQLYRYGGRHGEIRALEREIIYLQRRNDFLRSRIY